MAFLEKHGLIRTLAPTRKVEDSRSPNGAMDVLYMSAPRYGSHKLICVKPNSCRVMLNSHPDNEEFILVNPSARSFRPLHMLIGLSRHDVLREKAAAGALEEKDFVLVKMRFNDPASCVFTMRASIPHCEIVFPGRGGAPVFFVAEPSRLPMNVLKLTGYSFDLHAG